MLIILTTAYTRIRLHWCAQRKLHLDTDVAQSMTNRSPSARYTPVYPHELPQNARSNMRHDARQEDNVAT